MNEFHSSSEVVTLDLSLFVFGLAISPMVLGPLSEVSATPVPLRSALLTKLSSMAGDPSISCLFSSSLFS